MNVLGVSTGGWASVGKGLARSLQIELDYGLHEVSTVLVKGISHLSFVSDSLDTVMALLPSDFGSSAAADQQAMRAEVTSFLQERQEAVDPGVGAGLARVVQDSVHRVVSAVVSKVSVVLHEFLELVRPALERIGEWIVRFGDRVQAGISVFSVTLDRVQKLIDQIMSQLAGHGYNEQEMVDEAFNLIDASNTGYVTIADLKAVADLYRITALQGDVPEVLTDKYDASGDGKLSKSEIAMLAEDEKLPNLLTLVLRTYGRRLAEASGNVAAARHRDEVAQAVVDYFTVVCAKNATKVSWIADRLGNGSLPTAFTADVIAQACLSELSPDKLATVGVGETLLSTMYHLHPDNTLQAFDLMANASFWVGAGLPVDNHPMCVGKVASWIAGSKSAQRGNAGGSAEAAYAMSMEGLLSLLSDAHRRPVDTVLLDGIPERARRLAREGLTLYSLERREERSRRLPGLNSSQTPKFMMTDLYSSIRHGDDGTPSDGEQAVGAGQLASPETLQFARWLAINASRTAGAMHDICFAYSSESSGALDSVADQIQKVVAQVQGFLDVIMKYATPAGIQRLEDVVEDFEASTVQDLTAVMEKKLFSLVNKSLPALEALIGTAAHHAGQWIGQKASKIIEGPLGDLLAQPLAAFVADLVQSESAGRAVSEVLGPDMAKALANLTADTLAEATGQVLEALVEQSLVHGTDFLNSSISRAIDSVVGKLDDLIPSLLGGKLDGLARASLHDLEARRAEGRRLLTSLLQANASSSRSRAVQPAVALSRRTGHGLGSFSSERSTLDAMKSKYVDEFEVGRLSSWGDVVDMVTGLAEALPATVKTVKSARKEVSKLSSDLDSAFSVLDARGRALFDTVATFWRTLWILYFCALVPLHCYLLYYGFWAGGFFGGPSPLGAAEEGSAEAPKSFKERVSLCMDSCSVCMKKYHDTELCFWSVILLAQVIVLILFILSILLCAVAGIKAFLLAGCTQMYILGDEDVCREELGNVRRFLSSFFIRDAMEPLYGACGDNNLLTCQLITHKMIASGVLTTVFSVLGTLFGLQLVVNSAILHEQARWRRLAAAEMLASPEEDDAHASPPFSP